ncbi:MAG: response regulator, partial [Candidatus Dadabacteria bacterium]|nr:response regulator [Candidatus Dadabacteria bacterium]
MQKKRVLVVDDEHEILRIIYDLLSRNGYHVDTATTCEKALKLFGENEYNTILSDIKMPQKSGIDLLEVVNKSNPELPVVIMTGYASLETAIEALKQGAFDYLTKPLDYQKLKSIIVHAVENNQLRLEKNRLLKELKELNASLENKVKERNRELLNILASTKESIITTDRDMKVISSNLATIEIYGEDCLGKRLPEFMEGINFKSVIHKILKDPDFSSKHETKLNDKFLEVGLSQLVDYETKEIFGTIVVTEDITEKKQLEAQVIQSAKMSAVGQLAAGIAHEFNNILTGIMGYTSIAMTRSNFDEVNRDLQIVENASDRAADIVNKLLTFSRSNEEKYRLVIMEELIEDTLALIEGSFESEGINILRFYGKMPPVRMKPGEIQQVILNMAINSKHAMKDGGVITIQTEIEDDFIKIDFSDTGEGIPKENISKIFEPFFSTKNEEADQEGTGLGLSVAYAIIDRHGGRIEA